MAQRSTNSGDQWYLRRCPSSPSDRVTFLSPATIHRPACIRLHRIFGSGTPRSVIYTIDCDCDFVHSIHHHYHQHYHYHHHRCCNGSYAMTSAITWPRYAFAWKSESLNKLLAAVCERFDIRSERSSSSTLEEWPLLGEISFIGHVRLGNDFSPRRRLSAEGSVADRELAAERFSADRRMVWRCFWFWRSWSAPPMSLDHLSRLRCSSLAFCLPTTMLLSGARARWTAAIQSGYPPVNLAVDETRIRVPMHKGVDLQLRIVESMRRRFHHVTIHYFPYPRIQTHLQRMKRMS